MTLATVALLPMPRLPVTLRILGEPGPANRARRNSARSSSRSRQNSIPVDTGSPFTRDVAPGGGILPRLPDAGPG